jgi:hypothetical protein
MPVVAWREKGRRVVRVVGMAVDVSMDVLPRR